MNQYIFQGQRISVGDKVAVHQKIEEEGKSRVQIFEGLIIAISGKAPATSITVRKIATNQIGVERIIPLGSPLLQKIELKSPGKVKRSKLYYLRERVGRSAIRVKEDRKAQIQQAKDNREIKAAAKAAQAKSDPKKSGTDSGKASRKKADK